MQIGGPRCSTTGPSSAKCHPQLCVDFVKPCSFTAVQPSRRVTHLVDVVTGASLAASLPGSARTRSAPFRPVGVGRHQAGAVRPLLAGMPAAAAAVHSWLVDTESAAGGTEGAAVVGS